jgi:hypothetical protein
MDRLGGFDASDLGYDFRWVRKESHRGTHFEESYPVITVISIDNNNGVRIELKHRGMRLGRIWVTHRDAMNKRKTGEWSPVASKWGLASPTLRLVGDAR